MDRPGELIRRATGRMKGILRRELPRSEEAAPPQENLPPPVPVSRHGSYTALMRSHDRVHTRHIPGGRA